MQNSSIKVTLEPTGLREKTTQVLRDAILNLHFRPGQKLVERALCEGTGVSRTCIREALRHLEAEGLVSRLPNRGIIVAEVGTDEARQIYESRAVLEAAMARHFAERADADDFAMLDVAFKNVKRTIFGDDVLKHARALDALTDAVMQGADNDVARQMTTVLRARITYLRTITTRAATQARRRDTVDILKSIIEALKARRADEAEKRWRAYVERSASFAREILLSLQKSEPQNEKTGNR
jgi:DNA-binding GntR family transcriptional regulator